MRTALECLSGLAVMAGFNSPNVIDRAQTAIDGYLDREAGPDPLLRIKALSDLRDAFTALKMDSANGQAIAEHIEARMFNAVARPQAADDSLDLAPREN
jgi:hypothetical protein